MTDAPICRLSYSRQVLAKSWFVDALLSEFCRSNSLTGDRNLYLLGLLCSPFTSGLPPFWKKRTEQKTGDKNMVNEGINLMVVTGHRDNTQLRTMDRWGCCLVAIGIIILALWNFQSALHWSGGRLVNSKSICKVSISVICL